MLALAIVTSAFPVLSATDGDVFDRTSAGSTRAVVLMSWLGTAVIAAVAVPAAHILAKEPEQVSQLIQGFLLVAPGVAGFALITSVSRVMFALGRLKVAAIGLVRASCSRVLTVPLVELMPPQMTVGAIALGGTVGQLAVAVPMVIAAGGSAGRGPSRGSAARRWWAWWRPPPGRPSAVAPPWSCRPAGSWTTAGRARSAAMQRDRGVRRGGLLFDRGDLKTAARRGSPVQAPDEPCGYRLRDNGAVCTSRRWRSGLSWRLTGRPSSG